MLNKYKKLPIKATYINQCHHINTIKAFKISFEAYQFKYNNLISSLKTYINKIFYKKKNFSKYSSLTADYYAHHKLINNLSLNNKNDKKIIKASRAVQ